MRELVGSCGRCGKSGHRTTAPLNRMAIEYFGKPRQVESIDRMLEDVLKFRAVDELRYFMVISFLYKTASLHTCLALCLEIVPA
jgi:hypothetical protein